LRAPELGISIVVVVVVHTNMSERWSIYAYHKKIFCQCNLVKEVLRILKIKV
jgi:hypothetical protein